MSHRSGAARRRGSAVRALSRGGGIASPCMSARAYEHLCSDYPQVDAASLAALRDVLAAETTPAAVFSGAWAGACSAGAGSFPLTIPFLAGLEWAVANAARQSSSAAELRGLAAEAASAGAYAEIYALGCVLRAARLVTAHASGRDISAALRSYLPPAVRAEGDVASLSQSLECEVDVACTMPTAPGTSLALDEDGPARRMTAVQEEVWADELDDDDVPYEPLTLSAAVSGGDSCSHPAPASSGDGAQTEALPVQVKLAHLLGSLTFAPLSSLASPAAWSHAGLGPTILEAIRTAAHAVSSGSLSSAAAEQLVWPLLSLVRERLRSAPATLEAELPAALHAAGPLWRPRFLSSLLGDGGLLGHGAPPCAYTALEAAVCTELPALIGSQQSDNQMNAESESMSVLLALLRCFLDAPKSQAARAAKVLLASGAPQLIMHRRLRVDGRTMDLVDDGAEWRWLLSACCRHRSVLAFAARVPQLLGAIRSSTYLQQRASERVAWLWLMSVEWQQPASNASPAFAAPAAAAQASSSASSELDSEALVALQEMCFNACPSGSGGLVGDEAFRPAAGQVISDPSMASAVGDERLRRRVDSLLVILELLEILTRATSASISPRDLFLSATGWPLWSELESLGKRSRSELMQLFPAGSSVAGTSPNDSASEQKRPELLERVCRTLKALQLANAAPCKSD